jgi:2-methylisocitrate lyase-like PEP mutase family enzyme
MIATLANVSLRAYRNEAGVKRISVGSALARLAYGSLVMAAREMIKDGTFGFRIRPWVSVN